MPRLNSAIVAALVMGAATVSAQQPAVHAPSPRISKQEAALRAQAKVSEDSARALALRAVPGSVVKASELEKEKGKLIWSFDLKIAGKKGVEEVQVDAITGRLVSHEHESDAVEAKEAKDEAKASTGKPNNPVRKP